MSSALRRTARLKLPRSQIVYRTCVRYNSTQQEAAPTRWEPAHKSGEYPLYDMALQVIQEDSERLYSRIQQIKQSSEGQDGKEKLEELEVLAEMNKPEVLWAFKNGKPDMSKPVYRFLAERKWRREGKLDHLMQRIHTMNIVPDLVGDFHPDVDISVSFGRHDIEVGTFVDPEMTIQQPTVHAQVFHPEERYYTLIMVDPDVPDVANSTYQTYLHWLIPNIPISSTSASPLSLPDPSVSYIPPHPQDGTPYHRYTILLLSQPNPTEKISMPSISSRAGFNLRTFIAEHGFKAECGGGHFWRELWSPAVSQVYQEHLERPEPRYGRPPKVDKYEEVKRIRRYI